jgi:hypothetical protein
MSLLAAVFVWAGLCIVALVAFRLLLNSNSHR